MSRDVMWDIETLGNRPGCAMLSIGAIGFDLKTGELGETFHAVINTQSCVDAGMFIQDQDWCILNKAPSSDDTLGWWKTQSPEAQDLLRQAREGGDTITFALNKLAVWLVSTFGADVRPWGCGAAFDNAIMAAAYRALHIRAPWKFWNDMCYRTQKNLYPNIKMEKRVGVYHNALDDARSQAIHLLQIKGHDMKAVLHGGKPIEIETAHGKTIINDVTGEVIKDVMPVDEDEDLIG